MKDGTHLEKVQVNPSKNWVMRRSASHFSIRRYITHIKIYTCGLLSVKDGILKVHLRELVGNDDHKKSCVEFYCGSKAKLIFSSGGQIEACFQDLPLC